MTEKRQSADDGVLAKLDSAPPPEEEAYAAPTKVGEDAYRMLARGMAAFDIPGDALPAPSRPGATARPPASTTSQQPGRIATPLASAPPDAASLAKTAPPPPLAAPAPAPPPVAVPKPIAAAPQPIVAPPPVAAPVAVVAAPAPSRGKLRIVIALALLVAGVLYAFFRLRAH